MIKGIHHISMKCGTAEELAKVREFYIEFLCGLANLHVNSIADFEKK